MNCFSGEPKMFHTVRKAHEFVAYTLKEHCEASGTDYAMACKQYGKFVEKQLLEMVT